MVRTYLEVYRFEAMASSSGRVATELNAGNYGNLPYLHSNGSELAYRNCRPCVNQ